MIEAAIIAVLSFLLGAGVVFIVLHVQARINERLVNSILAQNKVLQRVIASKDLAVYGAMTEIEEKVPSKDPGQLVQEANSGGGVPQGMTSDGFFPGSGMEHMG